jgi:transposase
MGSWTFAAHRTNDRSPSLERIACRLCENSWGLGSPGDSQGVALVVHLTMSHISGTSRSQLLLLPEAVDDYVGLDNPVRFIEAFVDNLDIGEVGFERAQSKSTGRPGYDPRDLLKLYIYGYLNRVRSSRRLEVETHRNIEVIWLMRQLKPDFKTIADFRRVNCSAFRKVFRQFVILCRELDLFGRELLAVDGTRIKAVNNKNRNFTRRSLAKLIEQSDERLERYLRDLERADGADNAVTDTAKTRSLCDKIDAIKGKRDRLLGHLHTLEENGESQISLTDPDSRAMARMTKVGVGYNIQIAVDTKYKLIAEQQVHNQVLDYGFLAETTAEAMKHLDVENIKVVADKGYFQIEDITECVERGIEAYVPKPLRGPSVAAGLISREEFNYDPEKDIYICPQGQELKFRRRSLVRTNTKFDYCNVKACAECEMRSKCTKGAYRTVTRYEGDAVLEQMAKRLRDNPEILTQRRNCVEHPFGTIKQTMNQGAFLMRRLQNVRGEFSLTALAYNIKRALNLVGAAGLIAAME